MRESPLVRDLRRRLWPWWRRDPFVALAYALAGAATGALLDVAALALANWWAARR